MGINPNTGQSEDRQAFILDEMRARVSQAKADGFDGIEFDTVDGWQNNTGLTITLDHMDHMTQRWTYLYKGKPGTSVFHYTRKN